MKPTGESLDRGADSSRAGPARYVSRWEFILDRCRDRRVLHLGCVGETEATTERKVAATLQGRSLHAALRAVAADIVGVDNDAHAVSALNAAGFGEVACGDALDRTFLSGLGKFDVVLCGDLIEHVGSPGALLESVKGNMSARTDLIITTPNAFGALAFARHLLGVYREGSAHVLSFTIHTLGNLLRDHGLHVAEALTCHNRPARGARDRLRHGVGVPVFRLVPKVGGTLLVVARLAQPEPERSPA